MKAPGTAGMGAAVWLLWALTLAGPSEVLAQSAGAPAPLDAGAITREKDRLLEAAEPVPPTPGPALSTEPSSEVPPEELGRGPSLFVSEWAFEGNRALSAETLRTALSAFRNQTLTMAELNAAVALVGARYSEAGLLADVALAAQEVVDGVVTMTIQEGRFSGVRFEGPAPKRIAPARIAKLFETRVAPGELLRLDELDTALLLANELPGINLQGALAPGATPGSTQLVLRATSEAPGALQVAIDSYGARATGAERLSVQGALRSPLGQGDRASVAAIKSEGSDSYQLSYVLPLGARGLRLSATAGRLEYDLVPKALRALDLEGRADTAQLSLTYPLLRTRRATLRATLSGDWAAFENQVQGARASDYNVTRGGIGLSGYRIDDFLGGGVTSVSGTLASGRAEGTERSEGDFSNDFTLWRYRLARQQPLTDGASLFLAFSGQHGPSNLDTSQSFSLGGPAGVRAYPVAEGLGASGWLAKAELRKRNAQGWLLKAFYDHGRIEDRGSNAVGPASYDLRGIGFAVEWSAPGGWLADFIVARRLGTNPNAIEDPLQPGREGEDRDGSFEKTRVWFSVLKSF